MPNGKPFLCLRIIFKSRLYTLCPYLLRLSRRGRKNGRSVIIVDSLEQNHPSIMQCQKT